MPRYLFLVLVPRDSHDYVQIGSEWMRLQHLGYFVSLQQEQRISQPDGARRRPVRVPVGNVLTVKSLIHLVHS